MDPVRLGNVLELERIPVEIDPEKEYTQIGIRSFGKGIFHRDPIPGSALGKLRYFKIRPQRLVISNIMAWEGAIALSTEKESECIGSHRFLAYRPIGDVDLSYLNYFFQSDVGLEFIRSASTGTVARNQTLSVKDFEALKIPLPKINEQRRVASKLDSALSQIRAAESLRRTSQNLRSALHDSLFRKVKRRRPLGDGLRLALDEIPVEETNMYRIAGVYGFGRGLIDRGQISGSQTKYRKFNRLHPKRLIVSRLKAFEGALAVIPEAFGGYCASPEFPTFSVIEEELDVRYLHHLCRWPTLWSLLSQESKGVGARRERVTADRLLSTVVPFPDIEEQRFIAGKLDLVQKAEFFSHQQEDLLKSFSSTILNAAFTGRL